MADATAIQRREIYYSGRVQGVGFRYTTQYLASRYQVTGFVRNLPDGRVELVVEGSAADVEGLLRDMDVSLGRYVRDAQVVSGPATGRFTQFEIRH